MAYRSQIDELARMRTLGQKPEGFIVVGDNNQAAAWASRNRFFYVPANDCVHELDAFTGLDVLLRSAQPGKHRELAHRLALNARFVTVFDAQSSHSEFLLA